MKTLTQNYKPNDEAIVLSKIDKLFQKNVCQNILLVQPMPLNTEYLEIKQIKNKRYYAWQPYGLAVLCANLKSRGYNVKILDLNYEILHALSDVKKDLDNEECSKIADSLWRSKLKQKIDLCVVL